MRSIDISERRARLARRHRLAEVHLAADVVDVAQSLVALHATDPPTVVLSARARTSDTSPAELTAALEEDRTLVRVMAMRRTLWVVPRPLLPAIVASGADRVAGAERRRLAKEVEQAGLHTNGAEWLDAACEQAVEALGDDELNAAELRERAPLLEGTMEYGAGKSWGGTSPVAPRVLTILNAEGRILRATNDGGWYVSRPRYARAEVWLGESIPHVTVERAMAELVERWLRAFGPATEDDITWWFGTTKARVRHAIAALGAVEVDLDGSVGFVLADDVDPVGAVDPWVALLPVLDPTTMGWKHRDWYVGAHRAQLFDSAGNGGSTIWSDGAIVGGWWQHEDGSVETELLEDVGGEAAAAIDTQAGRLTEWFEGRRVLPRFPSPLASSRR